MYLSILDLVLILVIFAFVAFGFALGLVQSIGALVGVVAGTWLAGMYYEPVAGWLEIILLGNAVAARVIAFILLFTIVNRLVGLAFWLVNKIFNLISIIPFAKSFNRILGALFGLIEAVLAIGTIVYFTVQLAPIDWWQTAVAGSQVAQLLIQLASILTPLLPEIIKAVV
ncbi:MAG: CvpA family protein [Candidatus Buchananbacteria bacterium]|nr:CvpA family protein [Candidatus Buchananbacteria bacterium]